MNTHLPAIPHVQPATPLHNGRRQHELPYTPAPPPMTPSHPYHGYQQPHPHAHPMPPHFHQQHPQQWYQYPNMPPPMPRPYSQYPPMVAPPYPTPQGVAPMPYRPYPPPHAPSSSSIRSQQDMLSPSSSSTSLHVPTSAPPLAQSPRQPPPAPPPPTPAAPAPPTIRLPFYPPLPWFSVPDEAFPPKSVRRRRRKPAPQSSNLPVELPPRQEASEDADVAVEITQAGTDDAQSAPEEGHEDVATVPEDQVIPRMPAPATSNLETPITSHGPSEADSTHPTTPSSAVAPKIPIPPLKAPGPSDKPHRPAVHLMPIIPVVPNISSRPSQRMSPSAASGTSKLTNAKGDTDQSVIVSDTADLVNAETSSTTSEQTFTATAPHIKAPPKSWADLVRTKASSAALPIPLSNGGTMSQTNGHSASKAGSLADILSSFSVDSHDVDTKIAFLEPRGLVNTGNMCYMNAILQILMFCTPFYDFLDKVGKQAVHSFKSDTPLVDAMIMFMREFSIIDSAISVEQLRMRLKDNELEQYGEAFIPEFVYEVIRRLPRLATMRRGHQQDAEEFLGFLLEEMHDECAKSMRSSTPNAGSDTLTPMNGIVSPTSDTGSAGENGWLEVGPKQKAAITRLSGAIAKESPITKIFGGKIRSELRVPGMKNSVTSEPYQPLQLDIGSPQVNNITDALKGLTRSETLHGDFNSPRGPGVAATKQLFIDTLPPVLILHLKRFQYDNTGGTQKIWKKVGYPLELEIPKEVFPPHKRGGLAAHGGLPKYRLIGVVYHHGKNASGGHYTVDVRRQEGREWIRLDDTIIRRVRSEDVAEGGSEEDPKLLAAALEQHKRDQSTSGNIFEQMGLEEEETTKAEKGWSQVNGATSGSTTAAGKKWSGVVNGTATPASSSGKRTPVGRSSVKDNKVAYILFYQKISA